MPWPVVLAVAEFLASVGKLREGVAVVVSAHCWLRVGEVVGLRHENFAASDDARLGAVLPFSVLSVQDTKTKRFDSVEVTRRDVSALLSWLQDGPGTRLFPFTKSHPEGSLHAMPVPRLGWITVATFGILCGMAGPPTLVWRTCLFTTSCYGDVGNPSVLLVCIAKQAEHCFSSGHCLTRS